MNLIKPLSLQNFKKVSQHRHLIPMVKQFRNAQKKKISGSNFTPTAERSSELPGFQRTILQLWKLFKIYVLDVPGINVYQFNGYRNQIKISPAFTLVS
jgi:hypothetical protein